MGFIIRFLKSSIASISPVSLLLAVSVFGASLTPTLTPRDLIISGAVGGAVAALGYEAGYLMTVIWRYLELPGIPKKLQRPYAFFIGAISVGVVVYSLAKSADWQNATRTAIGLEPIDASGSLEIFAIAVCVAAALFFTFRLLAATQRKLHGWFNRIVPRRIGYALSTVIVLWLFWALIDGALIRNAFKAVDSSFEAADILMEAEIAQPQDPMKNGSKASLVDWQDLGRRGRQFIATAPNVDEISAFYGAKSQEPVRVYVGRRSAKTADARAELALKELIRIGGFERAALVVTVPTGTGWMDPGAHDTIEFILGGDVATVAVQYSYLTSALALLAHPEYGVDQSRALFDVIYDHWTKLPRDHRPKLYVHGLSQGAYNSQETLPLFDMLSDPIHGAMWAGSPFFSRYWAAIRNDRNPDSPAWRPTFGNGSLVRVMNQYGGLEGNFAPWGPIRTVFLNYASDPIVEFTFDSAFQKPAWLVPPRAPDVPDELVWFPVVTMLQLAIDSGLALKVPGFGHYYIARDYIDAWAAVTDPPGWTKERARQLKAIFEARGTPL